MKLSELKDKLTGKTVLSINAGEHGWGLTILFTDGTTLAYSSEKFESDLWYNDVEVEDLSK